MRKMTYFAKLDEMFVSDLYSSLGKVNFTDNEEFAKTIEEKDVEFLKSKFTSIKFVQVITDIQIKEVTTPLYYTEEELNAKA